LNEPVVPEPPSMPGCCITAGMPAVSAI
jgi:hypothetical protein